MNWKALRGFFYTYLQRAFAYRVDALMWIVNGMIGPLIAMLFWIKVAEGQKRLAMGTSDFIIYFVMLTVVERISQSWAGERIAKDIKSGRFSKNLIRPLNYATEFLAHDLSYKILRLVTIFPFFLIIAFILRENFKITTDLYRWILFIFACILGFLINSYFQYTFALIAFFFEEVDQLARLSEKFTTFINGSLIPLILLPSVLQNLAKYLFPRFMLSFPLEIILGQVKGTDVYYAFAIGIIWLLIFVILHKIIWTAGIKKYTGVGI